MPTLAEEAAAAWSAQQAAETAAAEEQRRATLAAARDAVKTVLTRPDGTVLNFTDLGLTRRVADYDAGLFVWSDGSGFGVAAQRRDSDDGTTRYVALLVREDAGQWVRASDRLRSLADLGAALAAV